MAGGQRRRLALGLHQIGFVFLDANLVDAFDGGPEAAEVVDFVGVAGHADHLHDDSAFSIFAGASYGETDEIVAHFFEAGAFAVMLEGFLGSRRRS